MLFFCVCQVMNVADVYQMSRALDAVFWEELGRTRQWRSFPALAHALRHWLQRLRDAPSPLVLARPAGLIAAAEADRADGCCVWDHDAERACGDRRLFRDHGTVFTMCEAHFRALVRGRRMTHRYVTGWWTMAEDAAGPPHR
jgi:hypothetical protein